MINFPNHRLSSVFFILLSTASYAGDKVDETLAVSPSGKVKISIQRGGIRARGWDKPEIQVRGELDDAAEKWTFESNGESTTVKLDVKDGMWDQKWNSKGTRLEIFFPRESTIIAKGVSTDFDLYEVHGGLLASSVSGDIRVGDIKRKLSIETVSGDIDVTDSEGKIIASTISGDIEIDGMAIFLDAQSVSGDINARIGDADIIDLTSVSGDIELACTLLKDARMSAETVSGDLEFNFEGNLNANFDINTGPGGDIQNSVSDDQPKQSFIGSEKVNFKSGDGSASVDIVTMSGSVLIDN